LKGKTILEKLTLGKFQEGMNRLWRAVAMNLLNEIMTPISQNHRKIKILKKKMKKKERITMKKLLRNLIE
jgi:hypothetical protein